MKKLIVSMLVLLSFPLVVLGGSQEGNITLLLVHHPETGGNGKFDVELDGSISSTNCGTNAWSAELDTGAAEAQYAMLLAALVEREQVRIDGNPTQTCIGNREKIRNVRILP